MNNKHGKNGHEGGREDTKMEKLKSWNDGGKKGHKKIRQGAPEKSTGGRKEGH